MGLENFSVSMNTPPPLLTRLKVLVRKPIFIGPLSFIAGSFWIHTILNNFNSEKVNSSLFRGIIYSLRNSQVADLVGKKIEYDDSTRVKGGFDNFKGVADLEFRIKGEQGHGTVVFKGKRYRETDCWVSSEFVVTTNGTTVSL